MDGSLMHITAIFGLTLAGLVIRHVARRSVIKADKRKAGK